MKRIVIILVIFIFVSPVFGANEANKDQEYLIKHSISEFAGVSVKNRKVLIEYIKSRPHRYGDVLSITIGDEEGTKTLVIPSIKDVPLKSVKTECPKSIKSNECWFIKYEEETESIIITINQPGDIIPCLQPEPSVIQKNDGSYYRPQIYGMTLQICYGNGETWQEKWTDYPEKGGKFIRRVK
jgi:hypothetical protein